MSLLLVGGSTRSIVPLWTLWRLSWYVVSNVSESSQPPRPDPEPETTPEPEDIVAGFVHGHEMLLMDLGGINVLAMRTGATSDIVVDFRRVGIEEESASEDLFMVGGEDFKAFDYIDHE